MKRDRRYFSQISCVFLFAALCVCAEDGEGASSPYLDTLRAAGIDMDAAGIVGYLQKLSPTEATRKRVIKLVTQLGAARYRYREAAEKELAGLGMVAEEAVRAAAAEASDPEIRMRARRLSQSAVAGNNVAVLYACISVVAESSPENGVDALLQVAGLCARPYLQYRLETAVERIAAESDRARLEAALKDKSLLARRVAIRALGKILPKDQDKILESLLNDAAKDIRLAAAFALANRGRRSCLPTLMDLLAAADLRLRTRSWLILRRLTGQKFEFSPYAKAAKRAVAMEKWRLWIKAHGADAELHFPIRLSFLNSFLNGHVLLACGSQNKVIELDRNGKEVWSYDANNVWGAEKLANGNILIASLGNSKVMEVTPAKQVVWEFASGALKAHQLESGSILIADYNGSRVVEVARASKRVVWEYKTAGNCWDAQRLPNGNTLIGYAGHVIEVSPAGDTVWTGPELKYPSSVQRLENGNSLFADYTGNRAIEVNPDGKVVWEFKYKSNVCDAYRMANGNTLITYMNGVIEISPQKKIIWQHEGAHSSGSSRK